MTLTLNYLFYLLGVVLVIVAGMIYVDKSHPRRFTAGTFWLVYALVFLMGDWLPADVVGVLVIAMALIAGLGGVTGAKPRTLSDETRRQSAVRLGNRLFVPALTIPVVTVIGLQVGTLLAGAVLTETLFSWPGVGKWLIDAISRRDYPVVQGGILMIATLVILVNLVVDLMYGVLNPRIRHTR